MLCIYFFLNGSVGGGDLFEYIARANNRDE